MQGDLRTALVRFSREVLQPLARILVRSGVSAGELKSIVDSAYARAAADHLAARGERVTYSKLGVITGIHRGFMKTLLQAPQDDEEFRPRSGTQLHRAARVLSGWHDDPAFQTRTGEPAVLPIKDDERSFEVLVGRYSGGVYPPLLLDELLQSGAIKLVGKNRVRALRRFPTVGGANAQSLHAAAEIVGDLLTALEHNLAAKPHEQLPVRSLAVEVDAQSLPLFRAQLAKRADGLLEMTDTFLQAHRYTGKAAKAGKTRTDKDPQASEEALTLGAAVFAICRRPSTVAAKPKARQKRK